MPADGDTFSSRTTTAPVLGCDVTSDREGHWVELTVGFRDDVVRRRIGPYLTERIATVAAEHIRRDAGRQGPPPTGQ